MNKKIVLLPGDGIGPEVIQEARKILERVGEKYKHTFSFEVFPFGGSAIDQAGVPLPEETLKACKASDAVLMGSVGGPKWDTLPSHLRPEQGLLGLRKGLNTFANLRPAKLYPALAEASALKPEIIGKGLDLLVVRELTSGLYFSEPKGVHDLGDGKKKGINTMAYSSPEIERVAKVAFEIATKRGKKVCSVDKANVLEVSQLWREVVTQVGKEYPDIELSHMYVDNCAMQLIRNPRQFDVIVTENLFGDILSDESAMLTGSIGMLPSASLSDKNPGIFEPVHGSAPDIAGEGKANPIATILSTAMMLRYAFTLPQEATRIEQAVEKILNNGYRTTDILQKGMKEVSTQEMGKKILEVL